MMSDHRLLLPHTPQTTGAKNIRFVTFGEDIGGISLDVVRILRNDEKCEIVVLLAHLG
jgi:succinyl-CoA synthetase alpha subunit